MANVALIVYLFIYLWYSVILENICISNDNNNRTATAMRTAFTIGRASNVKGFIIFRSPFCKLNIVISQKMAKRSNTRCIVFAVVKAVNK